MYRLIISGAQEGAYNMAIDSAIFENFKISNVPPTIRFFWFEPPCISIGRIQSLSTLSKMKYSIVRRPTGGRAVVHKDDLSFSIICKRDDTVFGGNVLETYMKSSSLFVETIRLLGIQAEMIKAKSGNQRSPLCFQSKSRYEVICNGKKILGSAQRREGEFILLQGSMSLDVDREKVIGKYKKVMQDRFIEYEEGCLTEGEKSLAFINTARFKIENK